MTRPYFLGKIINTTNLSSEELAYRVVKVKYKSRQDKYHVMCITKKNTQTSFNLWVHSAITIIHLRRYTHTVDSRYLDLAYLEKLLISKWKSGPCFNTGIYQQATKYWGKVEKLLLRSNFSSFPQYFQYISNLGVKLHIPYVKGGCSINWFPQFRKSDMSKYGYLEVFHRIPWISR